MVFVAYQVKYLPADRIHESLPSTQPRTEASAKARIHPAAVLLAIERYTPISVSLPVTSRSFTPHLIRISGQPSSAKPEYRHRPLPPTDGSQLRQVLVTFFVASHGTETLNRIGSFSLVRRIHFIPPCPNQPSPPSG